MIDCPASHLSEYQTSYIWLVTPRVSSRWKTTSPFEVNGRRPPSFFEWKTTSICFENGRQPNFFLKMEDNLNLLKVEDDLKNIMQPKTITIQTKIKTMVVAPLRVT
jgi:hypothetical protein